MKVALNKDPIEIIRGDTYHYTFCRKSRETHEIITQKADKLYFSLKKRSGDTIPIVQKTIDDMTFDENSYYHFTILPEDTDNLPMQKTFYYDIERIQNNDKRTLRRGRIKITHEITHVGNEV